MNNYKTAHKRTVKFMKYVARLSPVEFHGIAATLCIPLFTDENARPFEELWCDIIDRYSTIGSSQQKQLLEVAREAARAPHTSKKVKSNG